ncbi:hypothetical protein DOTSEDRAFT_77223 [Dothistroma septosporum NZE10]|uniref:Uncharacterized protein n=1 Tax=Dothistroma septosporum (strain NZE10 / CBS 128990) TaxID=675120 RepID=N1Q4B9_DOTSN|nr:hypothetical protein DOTSEDRAFT_77223 [Dothistroma septosporum NZE10]
MRESLYWIASSRQRRPGQDIRTRKKLMLSYWSASLGRRRTSPSCAALNVAGCETRSDAVCVRSKGLADSKGKLIMNGGNERTSAARSQPEKHDSDRDTGAIAVAPASHSGVFTRSTDAGNREDDRGLCGDGALGW